MGKPLLSLGFMKIYIVGAAVASALAIMVIAVLPLAKLRKQAVQVIFDIVIVTVPCSVFAARLYYVLLEWNLYADNPGEIVMLWHGGLSTEGALLGFITALWLYCKVRKLDFLRMADTVFTVVPLGEFVVRVGSFFNQETFGVPTVLPWGVYIDYANRPQGFEQYEFFHPLNLYAAIIDIPILLLFIYLAIKQAAAKKPKNGSIFFLYLFLYLVSKLLIYKLAIS